LQRDTGVSIHGLKRFKRGGESCRARGMRRRGRWGMGRGVPSPSGGSEEELCPSPEMGRGCPSPEIGEGAVAPLHNLFSFLS